MYKLEITADGVAWYGAIVATAALGFTALNYWRDKARIKIQYKNNIKLWGNNPYYDTDKTYFNVSVINKGRRPIRVSKVWVQTDLKEDSSFIITDSMLPHTKKVLTEDDPRGEYLAEQDSVDLTNGLYIGISDATGKVYKKNLKFFPYFRLLKHKIYSAIQKWKSGDK